MIVFDLACAEGHVFEGWFGSTADYDDQRARQLLACPICGAGEVTRLASAARVPAKSNSGGGRDLALSHGGPPPPAHMKAMLRALANAQAKALEGSDYVGDRFAAEARAMHAGERDDRPIHGRATVADARALVEDGVPVAPLPLPIRPPGTEH